MARLGYLALFFVNAAVAALLHEFGNVLLPPFHAHYLRAFGECEDSGAGPYCVGNQFVYRLSFSICVFFMATGVMSYTTHDKDGCCCFTLVQLPFYLIAAVGSLFIPDAFFDGYATVARFGSIAFILLQIIIIIDSTYNLQAYLVHQIEQEEQDSECTQHLLPTNDDSFKSSKDSRKWKTIYLILVALATILTVIGAIIMFNYDAGCDLNVFFIISTLLASLVTTSLSVSSWVSAGFLPASSATLYFTFLCFQAVQSNPDASCHTHASNGHSHGMNVLLNAFLAAFTLTWTSWRTSSTSTTLFLTDSSFSRSDEHEQKIIYASDADDNVQEQVTDLLTGHEDYNESESDSEGVPPSEQHFHIIMFLGGLYMAMVLTAWGSSNGSDDANDQRLGMWVRVGSEWGAIGLFLWSLVAPTVFPDRDFTL